MESPTRYLTESWRTAAALVVLLLLTTLSVTGARATPPAPAYPAGTLPIATGDREAVYHAYGYALLITVRTHLPELSPYLRVTSSPTQNLELVSRGQVALGFASADAINTVAPKTRGSLATLARLYDDYLHLVVRRDSGVEDLRGLRGRRISVGMKGSGTERVALRLLRAAGVPRTALTLRHTGVDASVDALSNGQIDGFFFFGGVPTQDVAVLNLVLSIRLIDFGDWVPEARSTFHSQLSIPASAYDGVDSVTTLGVPTYLVVSRRMDPELAYALTAMLFEQRDSMAEVHPVVGRLDRRAAINTYPLRLHEGAVRYYRDTHI